jgi:uncharacterized protein (TIGR02266 family)
MANRRDQERVPTLLAVNFRLPGREAFIERYASNVSARGIFIVTNETHPVGTELSFELRTVDGANALRGKGRVAWVRSSDPQSTEPPGLGIAFTDLDEENRTLVAKMVEQATKAPREKKVPSATPGEAAVQAWLASLPASRAPGGARLFWPVLAAVLFLGALLWITVGRSGPREPPPDSEPALTPPKLITADTADSGT